MGEGSGLPFGVFVHADKRLPEFLDFLTVAGVSTCHLAIHSSSVPDGGQRDRLLELLSQCEIRPTVVFCLFEGEDYRDIPTVRRTVGLVPEEHRAERLRAAKAMAEVAAHLRAPAIGLHLGFLPPDRAGASYREIVEVTRSLSRWCAELGLWLHLETGQESAELLRDFLMDLGEPNVAVNFDPANMILYGTGDPVEAAEKLAPHIRSVHCKDARWSDRPGLTWGLEVPVGLGHVDFAGILRVLRRAGYREPLTVEREIEGEEQRRDIVAAIAYLKGLLANIWAEGD
ncbi:MAG: sugar phosphate isomerase/epimerase [candidate division KSB1 bacterium]|nr:sugar phosphate isomerase/epimerase [candidate division KSB1 bacterium]